MYQILRYILIVTVLLLAYLAALVVYQVPYAWLALVALGIVLLCKRTYRYTAYGTARWADAADIPHMLEGNGLILGHIDGKPDKVSGTMALFDRNIPAKAACQKFLLAFQRKPPKHLVRLTNAVHTAVFAPTGVGKGVSCVVPFLLTNPESAVVVDFKGENARITADARRRMGHKVVILDPFRIVTQEPDTLNPLEFIDKDSPTALDDCRDLAEALVMRSGQAREPHWDDSAEMNIAAIIGAVVQFAEPQEASLQAVRTLLGNPEKRKAAMKLMQESPAWDGILSRLGFSLEQFVDRELGSVMTHVSQHLRFLDTLAVKDSTTRSTFNPADLLTGKMTVYLVLPPEHMRAQSPLLRLWIGSMLRAVVKGGLQEKTKVHFILDEAASLGHMDALDDAVDKFRGYGVRLQLYYQSLGQLKKCWPEGGEQTLLSNTTQVFFGVNDQQTAEYVSNRLGEYTQIVADWGEGDNESTGPDGKRTYGRSSNRNHKQAGRKLLKPEEVTALDPRVAVTFTPDSLPIWTSLVRYYERGWNHDARLSPVKMAFDTACLFVTAATLAVMFTAGLYYHTFR
jgi:type IV secretion system protein VirD4